VVTLERAAQPEAKKPVWNWLATSYCACFSSRSARSATPKSRVAVDENYYSPRRDGNQL